MQAANELGIIGLGQIGGGLAEQALERGLRVVGFDSQCASAALTRAGVVEIGSIAGFIIDELLDERAAHLNPRARPRRQRP